MAGLISRSPRSPRQSPAQTGTDTRFSESSAPPVGTRPRHAQTESPGLRTSGTLKMTLACPPETRTKGIRVRKQVAKPKLLRCAIYTRKSSEEGLEQDFNSLHAQR